MAKNERYFNRTIGKLVVNNKENKIVMNGSLFMTALQEAAEKLREASQTADFMTINLFQRTDKTSRKVIEGEFMISASIDLFPEQKVNTTKPQGFDFGIKS